MNTTQDILIGEVTKGQGDGWLTPPLALPAPTTPPSPLVYVAVGLVIGLALGMLL